MATIPNKTAIPRLTPAFDNIEARLRILEGSNGVGTIAWPGGAVTSTPLVVTHGLRRTPRTVMVIVTGITGVTLPPVLLRGAITGTQFTVTASTVDGQLPLNTATTNIEWWAL